jgi:two-component system, chemotaxis family, protein-glutamate methylesterase/glutaminase
MTASIVVMGASWGGLAAVGEILAGLPPDFPTPVVLVQHRSRQAENLLARLLQDSTALRVVDVEDKEPLEPQSVYVAPSNYHVLVEDGHLSLTTDPLVRHSRPSIDVMFTSAADAYRKGTIGVVLTGANDDGARGLRHIIDRGGRGIVQDPDTAESRTMPTAALRACPDAESVPLRDIAKKLVTLVDPSRTKAEMAT